MHVYTVIVHELVRGRFLCCISFDFHLGTNAQLKVIQMRVSCTNIKAGCRSLEAWVDIPNAMKTRVSHRRLQHVP